jgi:acetoacetyl-CoA synthetase
MAVQAPQRDSNLARFEDWLLEKKGLRFGAGPQERDGPKATDHYDAMWRWSVANLEDFWALAWEYFDVQSPTPYTAVLTGDTAASAGGDGQATTPWQMPGARWFVGAQVNYAAQALRHAAQRPADVAVVARTEREKPPAAGGLREATASTGAQRVELTWAQFHGQVASVATALRALGVQRGDRVAAYLPNVAETVVAFYACASIGAVWSVCSPDMGPVAVLDRFRQIAPKLLIACDGYQWAGKPIDRRATVAELVAALPSLTQVVRVPCLLGGSQPEGAANPGGTASFDENSWKPAQAPVNTGLLAWKDLLATPAPAGWAPDWLPFDAPLWIVYSSGTTGLPKPIVHGHGGAMVEALKLGHLHKDWRPTDRFHWVSSTGWIMWNSQVSAMLSGSTIVLYDGAPNYVPGTPPGTSDWTALWRLVAEERITIFGAGAALYANWLKAGVSVAACGDAVRPGEGLSAFDSLRALGSTGSPLSADCYQWAYDQFAARPRPGFDAKEPIWLSVISGGTDFAGAFLVGNLHLPTVPGEMPCRALGAAVYAWSEDGKELVDEVGELVCTQPIPSMPLYFWGDEPAGPQQRIGKRYFESYFDHYPPLERAPGVFSPVWRHGDWLKITPAGGSIIYGRSDATINRGGVRMGTAELYRVVEAMPEVLDSMVVDLEYLGRDSDMPLFVVLREGVALTDELKARINAAIRSGLSARHVPNSIHQIAEVPRTLSGKKQELPIKKLLLGQPADKVLNRDAMANPKSLEWFIAFAAARGAA